MLMYLFHKGIVSTILLCAVVLSPQLVAGPDFEPEPAQPLLLVDSSWLLEHLDDPNIVVIDARSPAEYEQRHIAGAINLPPALMGLGESSLRVISQMKFEGLLGSLGIGNDSHVVIYGGAVYLDASRIFWALELYGHERVSLLTGGFSDWVHEDLAVSTNLPVLKPVEYRTTIQPAYMATLMQIRLAMITPDVVIVDTRSQDDYGGFKSVARHAGHIPTALNIPRSKNLDVRDGISYIKSVPELESTYKELNGYNKIILYCNGGREASIAYLALRLLNKPVGVYDGGWFEWGNKPDLPFVPRPLEAMSRQVEM